MVHTEFEKFVVEHITKIESNLATNTAETTTIKDDMRTVKTNLSDTCTRLTRMEAQRDTKLEAHKNQIRILSIIIGILGACVGVLNLAPKIAAYIKP